MLGLFMFEEVPVRQSRPLDAFDRTVKGSRVGIFVMLELENVYQNKLWLAGLDEAGRGPLAGPVVGACAFAEKKTGHRWDEMVLALQDLGVVDSKKSTSTKRRQLLGRLGLKLQEGVQFLTLGTQKQYRLCLSAQQISVDEIEKINILHAALKGMSLSFQKIAEQTRPKPHQGELWFDGNKCPQEFLDSDYQVESMVKGDSRSVLIGLASFLAKEYRDELMSSLDLEYPGYGLSKHAGYPTRAHREAIAKLGASPIHRKGFKGVREFL